MRKTVIILAVISIFVFISNCVESTDKAEVDAKIKEVASYLDKPGGPGSDGKIMFTLLLEAILQVAPETGFPPEFIENIEKAKDVSDSTSLFYPDGVVYLNKAYRLVNSGNDFQMPSSISEIQDAVNYVKMELATARKNLKVGKTDSCVKGLLEIALMIVIPIHQ
ncbi:MAG: hypothetical protein GTN73_02065 [Candidatus Aminicenantes bacterium]|nr:hypothetical protein [Candidatus Aminicenantes bacterium]